MKVKVSKKVIRARPTAAPTTMPATVSLESEWPVVDWLSCAGKTDSVDVERSVGSSDERLVDAIACPGLLEYAMEEEEVKDGRLVLCSGPVVPEAKFVGAVVGTVESG